MQNKKLKVFEAFAGIGAQQKAITRINKKINKDFFEIVGTCEWDIWANISYDAIHGSAKKEDVSIDKKIKYLLTNTWSRDGSTPIKESSLRNLPDATIDKLFKSVRNHKNFGSIITLSGNDIAEDLGHVDLITYSFPCQNLSTAGNFSGNNTGMKKDGNTRSGLLWEIERILKDLQKLNKLPKYLLLENVKAMLFKKNKKDYDEWIKFLDSLGYKTNTQILNGIDFGIPQKRERVFALSILDYKGPLTQDNQPKIEYKKQEKMKPLSSFIKHIYTHEEYMANTPAATPSRQRIRRDNPFLLESKYARTITTKQDRHPNAGTIGYPNEVKEKCNYRFISPREALMLMGFDAKDYDKLKQANIRKSLIHKQAGNSIIVNVLEAIFEWIFKFENEKK